MKYFFLFTGRPVSVHFLFFLLLFCVFFPVPSFSELGTSHKKHEGSSLQGNKEFLLPGEKAPDFTLISQNGNSVSLSEFSGNPVFITFIYTSCEASCSLILNNKDLIEQKLKAQTGLDAAFLAITVDPIRDSVSTLKNYLKMTGIPEKNLTLLTGETGDVKRVLTAYKIKVARWKETGEVAGHPNIGYVVGQNGLIEDVFVLDG